jgi:TRAP-type C4-dicarboxylate transport system substrate-binding protein
LKTVVWPGTAHTDYWEYEQFAKLVNEKSDGMVTLEYIGGNEVIPKMQMLQGCKQGVADVVVMYGAGANELIPGFEFIYISRVTPEQERELGLIDMLREKGKKEGVYLLGRLLVSDGYFAMYANKKIEKPDDFKGLRFGAMGWTTSIFPALGGTIAEMSSTEYYTAMDRGVIDGFHRSPGGTVSYKLHEVTDYIVGTPYINGALAGFVNLDVWNSLSPDQQQAMQEAQLAVEPLSAEYQSGIYNKALQTLIDNGMEDVRLSGQNAEWFKSTVTDALWGFIKDNYPDMYSEWYPKLVP